MKIKLHNPERTCQAQLLSDGRVKIWTDCSAKAESFLWYDDSGNSVRLWLCIECSANLWREEGTP